MKKIGLAFLVMSCFAMTVFAHTLQTLKSGVCYRCLKPGHFGFHNWPREIDRTTCNVKTAQYLETMGYRCYSEKEAER
jgi:hypothetical protein